MSAALDILVCALLLVGGGFALVGSWGMVKLSDFFKRLHGPTKASTLGVGGVLIAAMLWQLMQGEPSLRELLITLFLFMTAPVSAHLMAKAAISLDPSMRPEPPAEPGAIEAAAAPRTDSVAPVDSEVATPARGEPAKPPGDTAA